MRSKDGNEIPLSYCINLQLTPSTYYTFKVALPIPAATNFTFAILVSLQILHFTADFDFTDSDATFAIIFLLYFLIKSIIRLHLGHVTYMAQLICQAVLSVIPHK